MAQPVALKFLLTDRVNNPTMVERFIREARQSVHIDHPNCVRVTDFCATDDETLTWLPPKLHTNPRTY